MATTQTLRIFNTMKNKEQFDWAVSVLVTAYLEGTLMHAACAACAVGNLIGDKMGTRPDMCNPNNNWENGCIPAWSMVHSMGNFCNDWKEVSKGLSEIALTGYTPEETCKIEGAFEGVCKWDNEDPDGYLGLLAVVDALIEIHEGTEEENAATKQIFHDAKESKTVEA